MSIIKMLTKKEQREREKRSAFMAEEKREEKKRHHNLADFIVDHNKGIRDIVFFFVILSAVCYFFVGVNYDLTSYLPDYV
ncbi:MAG: hypothetical protein ACFNQE_03905, partial [Capnocytophaga leadbetteri]